MKAWGWLLWHLVQRHQQCRDNMQGEHRRDGECSDDEESSEVKQNLAIDYVGEEDKRLAARGRWSESVGDSGRNARSVWGCLARRQGDGIWPRALGRTVFQQWWAGPIKHPNKISNYSRKISNYSKLKNTKPAFLISNNFQTWQGGR
jgi:hypothetical protein